MHINTGLKDGCLDRIDDETRQVIVTLLARTFESGFREGVGYSEAITKSEFLKGLLGEFRGNDLDQHMGGETTPLAVLTRKQSGAFQNLGLDQEYEDKHRKKVD